MILLLFLFLFVVVQLIRCHCREKEYFFISSLSPTPPLSPTSITFLTTDELYDALISNEDKFFDTFFDYDMKARQIQSIQDYFPKIQSAVDRFSENEKAKIQKCTILCDNYLMTINIPGFDGVKASNIPWKIGKVSGLSYEYGLPHTRHGTIIVLPNKNINDNDSELTRTLIHEKIHLYQKMYSSDIEVYLQQHNMVRIKKRQYDDYIRANPDLDDWVYKDEKTGLIYKCEYSSKDPQNILDVKNTDQLFEHPFEKMAVEISEGR